VAQFHIGFPHFLFLCAAQETNPGVVRISLLNCLDILMACEVGVVKVLIFAQVPLNVLNTG
jgi:hypothetical protein